MTDKERLEEIKRKFDLDRIRKFLDTNLISPQDLIYLIQQAERVQELENKLENVMDRHTYLEGDYYDLQKQNERYRVAIRECIERMNEGGAGTRSFVYERLIEVLEGEK